VSLFFRSGIPSDVSDSIVKALRWAAPARWKENPMTEKNQMTEKDAIEELKYQYAVGNFDDDEFDKALDEALTSENPLGVAFQYTESNWNDVIERHTKSNHEKERER
jgi:hypothetical protein